MLISLVTVLSLSVLILELLFVIVNVILKERPQRIAFFRSFKKGKCAIIYLTAIPLYFLGHMYAGENFLSAFFDSISEIINLVVLKYDTESIQALMDDYQLYNFTIYFCFVLVGINALILSISLTNQYIWCAVQKFKAMMTRKDKLFLFGNNFYDSELEISRGVLHDFERALEQHKYIIPVASTGFCAEHILNIMEKDIDSYKYLKPYLNKLRNERNPEKLVDVIIEIIDNIRL